MSTALTESDAFPIGPAPMPTPLTPRLRRWRLDVRLRQAIITEILAAPLAFAWFGWAPWPQWWWPALIPAVLLLVAIVVYREATLVGWIGRLVRFWLFRWRSAARAKRAAIPEPVTVELTGADGVGLRWDGQYAVTMIALHGHTYAPTFLDSAGAKSEDMVPLDVIAGLLHQFGGLELAAIDVVSAGRRTSGARFAPTYDEIIGDRPAVGMRHTWLVLRLCPQACLAGMAYRGDAGGAAAAATERIRQALVRAGCRAVTCTADQMTAAATTMLGDLDLADASESWTHIDSGSDHVSTYRVAGTDLSTELVNDIWAVRSHLTVLTTRLTARPDAAPQVAALVRFHTPKRLMHPPVLELHSTPGQVFAAVAASLPLGNRAMQLPLSPRPLADDPLELPLAPAGFIVGTTAATGLPVLVSWRDPLQLTRVVLAADLGVVQQFVLRATATGSVVQIRTNRPQLWAPIRNEHIWVEDTPGADRPPVTMVVLDGVENQNAAMAIGERGHTVVSVTSAPHGDADLVLTQTSPAELLLTTPRVANVRLQILRPRNETQILMHLRGGEERRPRHRPVGASK